MTRYCSVIIAALILIGGLTFSTSAKTLNIKNLTYDQNLRLSTALLGPIEFDGRMASAIKNERGGIVGYTEENGPKMIIGKPVGITANAIGSSDRLVCSAAGLSIYTPSAMKLTAIDLESCLAAIKAAGAAAYEAYQVCEKGGVSSWKCKFAAGKATALLGFALYECSGLISEGETIKKINDEKNRPRDQPPCEKRAREVDYFDGKSLDTDGYSINCGSFDF